MLDSWCTQTTNMRTRQAPDPTWSSFHYAGTCLHTTLKHSKPMTNRGCSLSTSTLGTLSEAPRRDHINIQECEGSNQWHCTEDVTAGKNFTTCGNQKTWKTTEVWSLLTHHCSQHSIITHLDRKRKDNHAKLLYIDFIYFFLLWAGAQKRIKWWAALLNSHVIFTIIYRSRPLTTNIILKHH